MGSENGGLGGPWVRRANEAMDKVVPVPAKQILESGLDYLEELKNESRRLEIALPNE